MRHLRFASTRLGVLVAAVLVAFIAPAALPFVPLAAGPTTTAFAAGAASDINEALKIFFNDPIIENFVSDSELTGWFEEDGNVKEDETTGGRYIETAQYFTLPAGVGARAEGEYIPVPDGPVIKNSRVNLKKVQGVVEMTGDVMRRVKGDVGAYLNWMERALPDLVTRLTNEGDRMTLGFGAGIKARVAALPGGLDIDVDRAFGVNIGGSPLTDAFLQFLEGERIVFSANANGTPLRSPGAGQAARIAKVDPDLTPARVTVEGAIPGAVAVNDYIFAGDAAGASTQDAGGADREWMGLLGMVDDGTVLTTAQNILRSLYKLWNCVAINGGAAPYNGVLSEDLIVYADDQSFVLGGGKADAIVTSRSAARSYWKSLKGDRNINDPRGNFAGGKGRLTVILGDRELDLKVCRKLPPELAFGLQRNTFKRWTLGGYVWDDTTGAIWNRVTDGTGRKDAFFAVGNIYKQIGCLAPRKNWRVHGLVRA